MQASNVFQKLQPESQADKVPESSAAVSDNFSMAEKLQGMKDAAAELVKAPAQNGGISVPPDSSAPVTATPTPTLPSVPDAIASKIQPLQEAVQDALTAPASTSITVPDTASAGSAVMSAVEGTSQPVRICSYHPISCHWIKLFRPWIGMRDGATPSWMFTEDSFKLDAGWPGGNFSCH